MDVRARFWSKVDVRGAGDCWIWKAGRFTTGYGAFSMDGRVQHAPRVAFQLSKGEIPAGLVVMHVCDNPLCCNPDHLLLGTHADNSADMAKKGRASQGREHWTRQRPEDALKGEDIGTSKLSEDQARQVFAMRAQGSSFQAIADALGINKSTAHRIVLGRLWKHLSENLEQSGPKAVATEEMVRAIRAEHQPSERGSIARLARKYGLKAPTVQAIVSGRSWKHVT